MLQQDTGMRPRCASGHLDVPSRLSQISAPFGNLFRRSGASVRSAGVVEIVPVNFLACGVTNFKLAKINGFILSS